MEIGSMNFCGGLHRWVHWLEPWSGPKVDIQFLQREGEKVERIYTPRLM